MKATKGDEDRYALCPECQAVVSDDTEMGTLTLLIGHRLSKHNVTTTGEEELQISGSITYTNVQASEHDLARYVRSYDEREAVK